jgi:hypothetical protein
MKQEDIVTQLASIAGQFYVLSQEYLSGLKAKEMQNWEDKLFDAATRFEVLMDQAK